MVGMRKFFTNDFLLFHGFENECIHGDLKFLPRSLEGIIGDLFNIGIISHIMNLNILI